MSELVQKLSEGWHPVMVNLRPDHSVKALKECLERGYVYVNFTNTRGGTELGIPIDPQFSDLTSADLNAGTGSLRLVGTVKLDYVQVRCIADISLPELKGIGRLEPLPVEG
jgi:hypothetical protein